MFPIFLPYSSCLPSPNLDHLSWSICLGMVFIKGDNTIYSGLQCMCIIQRLRGDNGAENNKKLSLCRASQKAWASKLKFAGLQFDQAKPEWAALYGLPGLKSMIPLFFFKSVNLHNETAAKKYINSQRKRSKGDRLSLTNTALCLEYQHDLIFLKSAQTYSSQHCFTLKMTDWKVGFA